ncbi:MAG: SDR family oxidoreductase [Rubrobacter sp.]|jgi:NAD(P)-dependent dehydrogenase (short-subunit alcohol dehydrogenase family)|nr:SDR family oxidoreductase [Rubrobacter sp.]
MENGSNPTYVILGATGGIGSETVRRLSKSGANLVIAARNEDKLKSLADETGATSVPLDATSQKQTDTAFEAAKESFGRIDGAVNLVGSFLLKPAHKTCDKDFDSIMSLNVKTAFNTVRSAVRYMEEGGSVVLMSSVAGRVGLANHEAISAAKAAVIGLAMSSAATYLPRSLRFNAVAPGLVQTPMTEGITGSDAARQASTDLHPLGRLGNPEDIAPIIEWLLAPENTWVSGQVFGVDGGLSTLRPMPRRAARK